ncbi:hypothetical protein EMPG_14906 [Blastomyces silverae]|uniref:Uncharacterized protein n=1 Tax=Blastomyces silverae TaxID=2060906 RepID=A0A0H1BKG0_9EURO|nr:hypothetical protein EMPG_14906 [Blastomyces silverae]
MPSAVPRAGSCMPSTCWEWVEVQGHLLKSTLNNANRPSARLKTGSSMRWKSGALSANSTSSLSSDIV